MARMKQTPVKSAQKQQPQRKSTRERRTASKRGATESYSNDKKKHRGQSKADRKSSTTKRPKKEKGYLPPELRQAGLLAHQSIAKGKCFGPFKGQFVKSGKSAEDDHSLVCKITGVDKNVFCFYVHNDDKEKSMWLERLQSAPAKDKQNMVAYKSAVGVCYEATCDIQPGEELLVLYDDTYGGKKYPAYIENIPVHFVPNTGAGQLKVVPLRDDTEYTQQINENLEPPTSSSADSEDLKSQKQHESKEETPEEESEDEEDREDHDDDEDEIYVNDDDDHSNNDDRSDDRSDDDYEKPKKKKSKSKLKPLTTKKVLLQVYEVKHVNVEDTAETIKYQCSYCAEVYTTQEEAQQHVTSSVCANIVFRCEQECGCILESNLLKSIHKCTKNLKCGVCDMVFAITKDLSHHIKDKRNDDSHKAKCQECDQEFETMKDKREHLREKHNQEEDVVQCPVCSKKYTNLSYLREHIQTHAADAFKCTECEKNFSSRSNLFKHQRRHKPGYTPYKDKRTFQMREKKHECQDCPKRFDTKHALEVHYRSHTGERPYECDLCHWKFSQKPHLKRHMSTIHRNEGDNNSERQLPPAELPRNCEICNKKYANSRVLRVHIQSVHDKARPHKCPYCDSTFTQRGHLWRHKHTFHPDCEEVKAKILSAGCVCKEENCKQAFACQTDLLNHMSSVHAAKWPYICDKCDATFANSSNLRKHIRCRHATEEGLEKPFVCDDETCKKEFDSMYKLTQHKRTHTGEKEFKCDLCGQSFVQKSGLRKHIRCRRCPKIEGSPVRQQSKRKYECEECARVFPGPSDLKSHLRSHTGEKPFECNECKKRFSQTGNLTKHIKYVHNKVKRPKDKPREKKFYCSLCGKAFSCPSSLAMHCRTHTGNKPFKCENCEAAFAQLGNLKKHLKRWHETDGSGPVPKRRRTKKNKKNDGEANESQEQNDVAIETQIENEAVSGKDLPAQVQDEDESVGNECEEETTGNPSFESHENESDENEKRNAEQTAIASILTSINSEHQTFVNPRGFTPLNTPTQGFFLSPLQAAQTNIGPSRGSIIMSSMTPAGVSAQVQIPQSTHSPEVSNQYARPGQVFVPPQLGLFMSPTIQDPSRITAGPQTTSACPTSMPANENATASTTTMLPHVNTILSPQMNPQHYVPHGTMNQTTDVSLYPFSPSSLFPH